MPFIKQSLSSENIACRCVNLVIFQYKLLEFRTYFLHKAQEHDKIQKDLPLSHQRNSNWLNVVKQSILHFDHKHLYRGWYTFR